MKGSDAAGSCGAGAKGVLVRVVEFWPALPFMGFGLWAAWFALADSTVWLSPVESTGAALTNLNEVLHLVTGAVLLAAFACGVRRRSVLDRIERSRATAWVAGATASLGSLLLILIGPAYFQTAFGGASHAVFQVASVLLGAGMAVLVLLLAVRLSRLPLRRAMLYLCYAQLLAVFVYLAVRVTPGWTPVEGGPPFALVVLLVGLPLLTAASLRLNVADCLHAVREGASPNGSEAPAPAQVHAAASAPEPVAVPETDAPRTWEAMRATVSFAVVLFLFALVQAAIATNVTNAAAPSDTLEGSGLAMLLRVPVLMGFACFTVFLEARRFDFSRFFGALIVLLVMLVVVAFVVSARIGGWVALVKTAVFAFELLTWFLLLAAASARRWHKRELIAVNYGVFELGTGLGTLAGAVVPGLVGDLVFHMACVIVLLPTFLLVGEKSIAALFAGPDAAGTLEEVLGDSLRRGGGRAKGDFARRLDDFAADRGLSAREAETLRFLVAGRGDNQIAAAMGISYNTARTHVRNVYGKLGVHDRQTLIDVVNAELRPR